MFRSSIFSSITNNSAHAKLFEHKSELSKPSTYDSFPVAPTPLQKSLLSGFTENLENSLINDFKERYVKVLESAARNSLFSHFATSNINFNNLTLVQIFNHAFNEGGHRSRDVLRDLGWLDDNGNVNVHIPLLGGAYEKAMAEVNEDQNNNFNFKK